MGENSKIAWTNHTFNPWIGCTKVSAGCAHCYAESLAKRTGIAVWGDSGARHITTDAYWQQPLKWARDAEKAGEHRRVFCASLADVLEDRPELEAPRKRLWALIRLTADWLDWLLLTKRIENAARMIPEDVLGVVWLGTTVEDRAQKIRADVLSQIPAAVRFISFEPLLGDLEFNDLTGIDWVIVGGESGPGARPCDVAWIRSIVQQCAEAEVSCFVKQLGSYPVVQACRQHHFDFGEGIGRKARFSAADKFHPSSGLWRVHFDDRKGGDPAEWPEDLHVRQMPEVDRG